MREEIPIPVAISIAVAVAAMAIVATKSITHACVDNYWRDAAVKHGAAHYYLDQNNQRQWNWKEQQQ